MFSNPIVFGYHGCDASVAELIVTGKADLFKSESQYEWLGHGIYFWEDSPDRAHRWAVEKKQAGTHSIKNPAVVGAIIDRGNCLNLVDSESLALVKNAYDLLQVNKRAGEPFPKNQGANNKARELDCAVIETLHGFRANTGKAPFDTVRSFFLEGSTLYEGSGFRELDHIQICVRNALQIKGYFLPR